MQQLTHVKEIGFNPNSITPPSLTSPYPPLPHSHSSVIKNSSDSSPPLEPGLDDAREGLAGGLEIIHFSAHGGEITLPPSAAVAAAAGKARYGSRPAAEINNARGTARRRREREASKRWT
mmetsp:Transcript_19040/g.47790  ORF Transcript_19040/g.47790 Transcript_19040/m.47790 type:complete len:120 (+) Transcript_19040:272-631(+)